MGSPALQPEGAKLENSNCTFDRGPFPRNGPPRVRAIGRRQVLRRSQGQTRAIHLRWKRKRLGGDLSGCRDRKGQVPFGPGIGHPGVRKGAEERAEHLAAAQLRLAGNGVLPCLRRQPLTPVIITPRKKTTKKTSGSVAPNGACHPTLSMMKRATQKTAVASTAARSASHSGRNAFTQPARVLGWPAGARRVRAAGRGRKGFQPALRPRP